MRVIEVSGELVFEDGTRLYSNHDSSCCESHYLDFEHISIDDFEGLDFDLSNDNFFEAVDGYGIRLVPTNGFPVPIPGYGYNNGYYSTELELVLSSPDGNRRVFDISDCQEINY
jgi:hypothetical protein